MGPSITRARAQYKYDAVEATYFRKLPTTADFSSESFDLLSGPPSRYTILEKAPTTFICLSPSILYPRLDSPREQLLRQLNSLS